MASKQTGCNPITSKIKKTTQGGMVTQPILNMGAPVKMKASPNKQLVKVGSQLIKQAVKKNMLPAIKTYTAQAPKVATKAIQASKPGANKIIDVVGKTVGNSNTGSKFWNIAKKTAPFLGAGAFAYTAAKSFFGDKDEETTTAPTPSVTKTPGTTKKKPYVKPGGKATGNMKDYKIGSSERYNEYEARGWKQDATTKGGEPKKKARKKVEASSTMKPAGVKEVKIDTKIDPKELKAQTKKVNAKTTKATKPTRSQKLRAKGNAILADKSLSTEEKQKKALKTRRKYDRTVKRENKRAARKSTKVKYDETTGTGGSVAGNLIRSFTGKRTKDRLKAQAKKKGQAAGAIEVKTK